MKTDFAHLLLAKHPRQVLRLREVVRSVENQESFDTLFNLVFHHERLLVIRAADAVERITVQRPEYLVPHKKQLLSLLTTTIHKELKWHLPLLITRIPLEPDELQKVWGTLSYWAQNPNESPMVRTHALQGLHDLTTHYPYLSKALMPVLQNLEHVTFPSLQARVKKLRRLQMTRAMKKTEGPAAEN